MTENHYHFFAASAAQWATTTETRDLPALLDLMNKGRHSYNLFIVPVPHTTEYEINMFQPQVPGAEWLGTFTAPKKGSRK